jgi:hypothetical protein
VEVPKTAKKRDSPPNRDTLQERLVEVLECSPRSQKVNTLRESLSWSAFGNLIVIILAETLLFLLTSLGVTMFFFFEIQSPKHAEVTISFLSACMNFRLLGMSTVGLRNELSLVSWCQQVTISVFLCNLHEHQIRVLHGFNKPQNLNHHGDTQRNWNM